MAALKVKQYRCKFPGYFGSGTLLIPVPGHDPSQDSIIWPAEIVAQTLVKHNLAQRCEPILKRTKKVDKSAGPNSPRTVSRHYKTIDFNPVSKIDFPSQIIVVDDVVTSGATLFAATRLVRQKYPSAEVRAFALVRTLSIQEMPETTDRYVAPVIGTITRKLNDKTTREP